MCEMSYSHFSRHPTANNTFGKLMEFMNLEVIAARLSTATRCCGLLSDGG